LLIETYSKEEPKFILHLEFESKDDEEMIYRISEYHGIELRKYRLPIKHVVVYLGEAPPKMRTKLKPSEVLQGFTLVNARDFSPTKWLEQEEPSKIIMAILGDYQKKNAKLILTAIFKRLRQVCKTSTELKKYVQQLIIISRMRNLEQLTIKISEDMPITLDVEGSYVYKLGFKKANKRAEQLAKKLALSEAKAAKEKAALEVKATKAAKEKATLVAKNNKEKAALEAKVAKEKAILKARAAKVAKEKATLVAKNNKEKAAFEAKAAKEKAMLEAKAAKEKTALVAKAKAEKKVSIQKMQANTTLSNEEIMEFLNLDKKTFKQYLKEIKEEKK